MAHEGVKQVGNVRVPGSTRGERVASLRVTERTTDGRFFRKLILLARREDEHQCADELLARVKHTARGTDK